MNYQEALQRLSDNSQKIMAQLWTSVESGALPLADFKEVVAQLVAVANEQGRAAAELTLEGYMAAATGRVVPVAVAAVVDDTPRLRKALDTILESDQDTVMQLSRLAAAEPLEAAARRFNDRMQAAPLVEGWVRSLEPGACQLCVWWWREGRVWPKEHPMPTHKGCVCHPLPTFSQDIASTMYTRKLEQTKQGA